MCALAGIALSAWMYVVWEHLPWSKTFIVVGAVTWYNMHVEIWVSCLKVNCMHFFLSTFEIKLLIYYFQQTLKFVGHTQFYILFFNPYSVLLCQRSGSCQVFLVFFYLPYKMKKKKFHIGTNYSHAMNGSIAAIQFRLIFSPLRAHYIRYGFFVLFYLFSSFYSHLYMDFPQPYSVCNKYVLLYITNNNK